ncbi:UDP-glucose 6-dehydrogenase [Bacillus wiedmannii]|uniref:UDP-glucose dehydrogenase family protein n=1 Tax=Bacillus wiedmannii TaxID=1890302 RepID=UPI000BF4DF82|nr:UDP-glucose/GDP-mannose dehydrogenase family protein [Bacillus wiedmannii]PGD83607.1 UDP-glucose 6-dehydrogenase [Bacillus wiedmannii]
MKVAVVGTGYVGLVTGVCLSAINHEVICIDSNKDKVKMMQEGTSPIYEPGLEELMQESIQKGTLKFTFSHEEGFKGVDIIFIAVGTPQMEDGSANLQYVKSVAESIGEYIDSNVVVVTKSTVPVGTNDFVKRTIMKNLKKDVDVKIASNPEFLREGSAVYDTFHGDRIVIGTEDEETAVILEEMYKPLGIEVFKTDIYSSEMIKYASNAFLATKISFINEVSNICERLGANVEDVAEGMGYDKRIGRAFLNAGIGYGGSCFPKDTHALVQIAGGVEYDFNLLKSVIEVNNNQQKIMMEKIKFRIKNLNEKKVAILGLAFKPNTDDMREAAAIVLVNSLIEEGAEVIAYDPIAMENAKKYLNMKTKYAKSMEEALEGADIAVIVTEWDEFKKMDFNLLKRLMNTPIIFDGRNCFELDKMRELDIEYYSMGRPSVILKEEKELLEVIK